MFSNMHMQILDAYKHVTQQKIYLFRNIAI